MSIYDAMGTDVTNEREFGWDDVIEKDSTFILLPEGDYDFTVKELERARFNGSDKMPACNQAKLKLEIITPEGAALVNHNLFLHSKTEGMLSAFFVAIGHKQHGEKLKMNWAKVIGAKGRAKISIRTYNDKQYNEVKKFIDPEKSVPARKPFSAGKF